MPSHIPNSCITITCSSESQASWQRSPTETINYGDRTCGVARGTCETLDAARNDVTHPKHGRRLSCIPSRTSGLEEKAQRGSGAAFFDQDKSRRDMGLLRWDKACGRAYTSGRKYPSRRYATLEIMWSSPTYRSQNSSFWGKRRGTVVWRRPDIAIQ